MSASFRELEGHHYCSICRVEVVDWIEIDYRGLFLYSSFNLKYYTRYRTGDVEFSTFRTVPIIKIQGQTYLGVTSQKITNSYEGFVL